jgi:hypothetical protein
MIEKIASVHPLFDPTSLYGQMRATLRPAGKMRGYMHFLWARAKGATQAQQSGSRAGSNGAIHAPGTRPSEAEVLDVWTAQATFCTTEAILPLDGLEQGAIHLCLVREADGRHTLGCRTRVDELIRNPEEAGRWAETSFPCRAFLLEPEVVERLKSLLPEKPWQEAFLAETVANHAEVARILSAAPEMEGEVRGKEIVFEPLPLPERENVLPPRKEPLQVVIVCDTTPRPTPGNAG